MATDPSKHGPPRRTAGPAGRSAASALPPAEVRSLVEPVPRPRRRRSQAPLVLGLLVTAAVLVGLLFLLLGPRGGGPARPPSRGEKLAGREPRAEGGGLAVAAAEPADPAAATAGRYMIVDSGRMPWAPPTAGPRPRLEYLPPGSQLMLLARPAELLAREEGRLFLRSLGPIAEFGLGRLATWCGCEPADIESVQAGWQEGGPDELIGGAVVRLAVGRRVPSDEASREAAWGPTTSVAFEGQTYHRGQGLAFWTPDDEDARVLLVVSDPPRAKSPGPAGLSSSLIEDTIAAAVQARGVPSEELAVDVPRDLAALAGMLDADRHLTLFGTTHFLLNRGRPALAGPLAALLEPLQAFFGDSIAAAAISLQIGDNCYLEFDAVTPFAQPPRKEAPAVFDRLAALPGAVEAAIAAVHLDPYGKILVLRLPAMLRLLVAQARWAPEGEGLVINAYLPHHAAHNLALAAELAIVQAAWAAPQTAAGGSRDPAGSGTAAAALDRRITLVFPRDTLEMAVQLLSEQAGIPMEIVGPDLQLEGITKNQSFGLDERDKPARDVLRVILSNANPDGKLVYIVKKSGDAESLLITTRAAVQKRGDTLPPEFAPATGP